MKKRILAAFLCVAMLLTMLPVSGFASTVPTSGECGSHVTWKIENDVLTISGSGPMTNYTYYMNSGPAWNSNYDAREFPFSSVVIEPGVTSVGDYAFMGCKLTDVTIADTVTGIGKHAFAGVSGLTTVRLPGKLSSIQREAFSGIGANIVVPSSVTFIGWRGVSGSSGKTNTIYYAGTKAQWDKISFEPETWMYAPLIAVPDVSMRYRYGETSMIGAFLNYDPVACFSYIGDPNIYMSKADSPTGRGFEKLGNKFYVEKEGDGLPVAWGSSDESVLRIEPSGKTVPSFVGVRPGEVEVRAVNSLGETISIPVTVIDPLGLQYTALYDSTQYFNSGAFYSALSSMSDSVDIFVKLGNVMGEDYPCQIPQDEAGDHAPLKNVRIEASVSGSDLSFDKHTCQNVYTASYGDLEFGTKLADLLTLYPMDPGSYKPGSAGKSYTVSLTVLSDSMSAPVQEEISFKIVDAEQYLVDQHVQFISSGKYQGSKYNAYGRNMAALRDDPEYLWSKWSTLDFENYYEVVMADLLIGMLDAPQADITIVPKTLKKWHEGYDSLVGDVTNLVKNDCTEILDISETKIDKIIKSSKYLDDDEVFVDDALYNAVMKTLGSDANAEAVQSFFKKVDNSSQVFQMVSLASEPIKEFVAWGNTLGVMNAFDEADQELKQVFRDLADTIPDSEHRMKEAVLDYVNYTHDYSGQVLEIFDSFFESGTKIAAHTFKEVMGKRFWDYMAIKAVEWIGKIPLKGGQTLSTTKVFKTLTSSSAKALASNVLTGVSIGLTITDLICDSSSKASETGKLIAMADYSGYVIQVLESYEAKLLRERNKDSVLLFERAFNVHQSVQSYVINQTARVLEVKGESILQRVLGNKEYLELAASTLVHKQTMDSLRCCEPLPGDTLVNCTKVITVRCPVKVLVYNSSGTLVASVSDDKIQCIQGVATYVRDGEKFIAVSSAYDYRIEITATDDGTMEYGVLEFSDRMQLLRTVRQSEIPLQKNQRFQGTVGAGQNLPFAAYAITDGQQTYIPMDPEVIRGRQLTHMMRMYDPNSGEHFYTGSTEERDNLIAAGWNYEGIGFSFPANVGDPVYRLYEPQFGEHLYTMDAAEMQMLLDAGWNYEGIAFNSATSYEVAQYRLHNPNANRGAYHFTGSEEERDFLISVGWEYQGIGWYSAWG